MSKAYEVDKIDHESPDLHEGEGKTYLAVPFLLWSILVAFGIAYFIRYTPNADLADGDSRTPKSAATALANDPNLGANLYKKNCQACHQPTGAGLGAAFPPLAGSEWVQGDEETVAAIVLHGISGEIEVEGKTFKGVMPPFKGKLQPAEIAAVTTFIRSSWGNKAAPITAETVERIDGLTADRKTAWKGGAELKTQPWKK